MIETERLLLKPLTHGQLLKYIKDDHSLEEEFGLLPNTKNISSSLRDALEENMLPNVQNKDKNYLYHTLWVLISKSDNRIIGELSFDGEPDANGETEIGYSTYEAFRGKGFMTEAVAGITEWAREQDGVKSITASTAVDNIASYSILEKNNFVKTAEGEGMFTWKLALS